MHDFFSRVFKTLPAGIFALTFAVVAHAAPLSNCVVSTTSNTCSLYESDNGTISNLLTLSVSVSSGDVILGTAGGSLADPSTWLDALVFTDSTAQLISSSNALFPSPSDVASVPNAFVVENTTGATEYDADPNVYFLYPASPSVPPSPPVVPEPGSLLLLGTGICSTWIVGRRRLQSALDRS